ncbi:hypothetical protein L1887_58247 [Cichorium endivia]|nr:hypothetical protein L1887_58247 [Cichorium endivia]
MWWPSCIRDEAIAGRCDRWWQEMTDVMRKEGSGRVARASEAGWLASWRRPVTRVGDLGESVPGREPACTSRCWFAKNSIWAKGLQRAGIKSNAQTAACRPKSLTPTRNEPDPAAPPAEHTTESRLLPAPKLTFARLAFIAKPKLDKLTSFIDRAMRSALISSHARFSTSARYDMIRNGEIAEPNELSYRTVRYRYVRFGRTWDKDSGTTTLAQDEV